MTVVFSLVLGGIIGAVLQWRYDRKTVIQIRESCMIQEQEICRLIGAPYQDPWDSLLSRGRVQQGPATGTPGWDRIVADSRRDRGMPELDADEVKAIFGISRHPSESSRERFDAAHGRGRFLRTFEEADAIAQAEPRS